MKAFQCDQCGPLPHALYDGYAFGDRLLEGVKFEVRVRANGTYELRTPENSARYMADLNEQKWLRLGAVAVADEDTLTCPTCGGDIDGPAAG